MWPKDNVESWQQIHEFVEEFPDTDYWRLWKPMARDVIAALEARGLNTLFRVGQSMHHIIFSTLDHHRLDAEPRVTLEFDARENLVRVAYSNSNLWFNDPLAEERAPVVAAVPIVLRYLERLWSETRPDTPVPDALNAGDVRKQEERVSEEANKPSSGTPIEGARTFQTSRALRLFCVFGLVASSASALRLVQTEDYTWISVTGIGLALFFVAGVVDAYTSRVTLTEESIEVISNFRRRSWPREAFSKVTWAKGCAVALHLAGGGKVELPSGMGIGQNASNTLRAWLKRGAP